MTESRRRKAGRKLPIAFRSLRWRDPEFWRAGAGSRAKRREDPRTMSAPAAAGNARDTNQTTVQIQTGFLHLPWDARGVI